MRTTREFHWRPLSVIRALRTELGEAVRAQTAEEIGFALGPVELELRVELSQGARGEAGIKFWLVSIGGKRARSSANTQTSSSNLHRFDTGSPTR